MRQIRTVGAQTGPALLVNREIPSVKALLKRITEQEAPYLSVIADHEVRHSLWIVDQSCRHQPDNRSVCRPE